MRSVVFLVCVSLLAGAAIAKKKPGEVEEDDGLVRVENSLLDELFVAPGVSLANYPRVMLDPVEISFKDGWRQQHRDMSRRELDHFCDQLSTLFREKMVAELTRGGYTIVEAAASDVIRLQPSIVDADFPAPETGSDKTTVVFNEGQMTLKVKGFDSPSGALVLRARDIEADDDTQSAQLAGRPRTLFLAQQYFTEWAVELRSALDVARVKAGARTPQR